MTTPTRAADHDSSFDLRWARWQAAGAAQDRIWNRRAVFVAVVAFGALAVGLAMAVYRP